MSDLKTNVANNCE